MQAIKNNLHCQKKKQNGQNNHLNVPISNASDEASLPESLASKVGDTQLQVQINAKGKVIYPSTLKIDLIFLHT